MGPLSWSNLHCTLVYMRRMNLKRLWPVCLHVQSLNPQCSQSHFHPLWRNGSLSAALRTKHQLLFHSSLPELSSLTRDDIVLVMESAAMSRSFLRFLLGPFGNTHNIVIRLKPPAMFWTPRPGNCAPVGHCDPYPERRPPGRPLPRP